MPPDVLTFRLAPPGRRGCIGRLNEVGRGEWDETSIFGMSILIWSVASVLFPRSLEAEVVRETEVGMASVCNGGEPLGVVAVD